MSEGPVGSGGDRPLVRILDAVEFVAHHDNTAVVIRDGNVLIANASDADLLPPSGPEQSARS
jgi:hypothetical protein